jgi:hypothetical protein
VGLSGIEELSDLRLSPVMFRVVCEIKFRALRHEQGKRGAHDFDKEIS